MTQLMPTQEASEIVGLDTSFVDNTQAWGRLLPLKCNIPSINMSKESYVVGRDEKCDIVLRPFMFDHPGHIAAVSKFHFRVTKECVDGETVVFVFDLSSNGTFIGDTKIGKGNKRILNGNEEISIASKTLRCFQYNSLLLQEGFPGEVTAKYSVGKVLGRGACGEVRHVFDMTNGQSYAMKIVSKPRITNSNPNVAARVRLEVEILKKVKHPCIVYIHDVIETAVAIYIILEFVGHGELFDRVSKLGQLSEDDAKFIFLQMVIATKHLHDQGITHRDLKPENILLSGCSNRCLIKVTDFGLSKFVDGDTMLRTFCGTPTYLAPEILRTAGAGTYTSSIDIWSLGVILFVCLVGYPPFTDERKDMELTRQITGGHYSFPDAFWKDISEEAKDLIKQLLTVAPEKRITLEKVLQHSWLDDQPIRNQLADLLETAGRPDLATCLSMKSIDGGLSIAVNAHQIRQNGAGSEDDDNCKDSTNGGRKRFHDSAEDYCSNAQDGDATGDAIAAGIEDDEAQPPKKMAV